MSIINCARRRDWPTGPGCNYGLPASCDPAERGWIPWRGSWICRACAKDDARHEDDFQLPGGEK